MPSKLDELVKALDSLDVSKLTVADLKTVTNPVLVDAIRKMIDMSLVPGTELAGHTSHSNHMSHFNHLSHGSSMEDLPRTPQTGPVRG
jgi:hypothetical protein